MQKLAASSGTVIYEEGNKLYICKSNTSGTSTFLFVIGILAFILLANGILQLTLLRDTVPALANLGLLLLGIAVVFIFIFWRVLAYQKKQKATPPQQLQSICTLDFGANSLLDSNNNSVAPLNQVWFTRKMQLTSSSPELLVCWPGGTLNVVKGNPFSGGIGPVENVLRAKGIPRK